MTRDEAIPAEEKTDFDLLTYIQRQRTFAQKWEFRKTSNKKVQSILNTASKRGTGGPGRPDLIYVNEHRQLLILIENKPSIRYHISKTGNQPEPYAIDGIKHYLSFFKTSTILANADPTVVRYFERWRFVGIAFSGDINDFYRHRLDTFVIKGDDIVDIDEQDILDERDYLAYFENIDLETTTDEISQCSEKINNVLRNVDSQKRPTLLSALMICLHSQSSDFKKGYQSWRPTTIVNNIPNTVERVLRDEGIEKNRIDILINEISFINTDKDLTTTDILKDILEELEKKIIPLFGQKTAYDIIGTFYEKFLRYAGIANVKRGVVLTPNHIARLFTELIDMKTDDVILDPACGTGSFLLAGMNKLIQVIENSKTQDKKEKIARIKNTQLIGLEKSTTMFTLALSNMLFRGDGKSQIFNEDFFTHQADDIIAHIKNKPTIGFVNPPFGGKDNKDNPTKKEIQFLEKLLDICARYVVIIAPMSMYFSDSNVREKILSRHRLKCAINMPNDLFQPNAMTHTTVAVFETNIPHTAEYKAVFYDLKEDGFVLSKSKGRTDPKNKWSSIRKDLLVKINSPAQYNQAINLVHTSVTGKDEWIAQAHSKTDYSALGTEEFAKTVREYVVFQTKRNMKLLWARLDELKMLEILSESISKEPELNRTVDLPNIINWEEFTLQYMFDIHGAEKKFTKEQIGNYGQGEYPYIVTSSQNNGVQGFYAHYTEEGKVLTIDSATVGSCFYQQMRFSASEHVEKLIPKRDIFDMNVYTALFLQTIISCEKFRYNFGRKFSQARIKETSIPLPVDKQGNPNWRIMEEYIQSLPYSSNL